MTERKVMTGQDLIDFVVKHNAQNKNVVCLPHGGKQSTHWAAEVLSLGMCTVTDDSVNPEIEDFVICLDTEYAP